MEAAFGDKALYVKLTWTKLPDKLQMTTELERQEVEHAVCYYIHIIQ